MKPTGKEDMDEMDDGLKRLYALAPDEQPPAALDRAILAQARDAVAAGESARRRTPWGASLAAAAVLVLGVAVTINMQQEQPEVLSATGSAQERIAVAPPAKQPDLAPAAPVESPSRREDRAQSSADVRRSAPASTTAPAAAELRAPAAPAALQPDATPAPARERSEFSASGMARDMGSSGVAAPAAAPVVEAQRKAAAEAPAVGSSVAGAYAPQPAPRPQPAVSAPQARASAAQPGIPVPPPRAQGAARAMLRAEGDAVTPLMAGANMTPEQWLARLAELKAQGRQAEFERELAEFRKRHPGHRIPEALLSVAEPPRQQ